MLASFFRKRDWEKNPSTEACIWAILTRALPGQKLEDGKPSLPILRLVATTSPTTQASHEGLKSQGIGPPKALIGDLFGANLRKEHSCNQWTFCLLLDHCTCDLRCMNVYLVSLKTSLLREMSVWSEEKINFNSLLFCDKKGKNFSQIGRLNCKKN